MPARTPVDKFFGLRREVMEGGDPAADAEAVGSLAEATPVTNSKALCRLGGRSLVAFYDLAGFRGI